MNESLASSAKRRSRCRGTIEKYIGGCLMAIRSMLSYDRDHGRNSVLCGLEMHNIVGELAPGFSAGSRLAFQIGAGGSSVKMVAGHIGSDTRVACTMAGNAVSRALHLKGFDNERATGCQ